jgi:hypothetical protein
MRVVRQSVLAVGLIAVPVTGFFLIWPKFAPPAAMASAAQAPGLGDLSALSTIVADVRKAADAGDLAAAATRITDLETAWDVAEPTLRPLNPEAWGRVDAATDDALTAMRANAPDPTEVKDKLTVLADTLAHPVGAGGGTAAVQLVEGIAVTDTNGHPIPCEALLNEVAAALAGAKAPTAVADLRDKATERCNADDDAHADAFSAQALAQLKK